MKSVSPATALKHVYHAVYLQMFFGAVSAVLIPAMTHQTEVLGVDARGVGAIMVFMGINIYCYLRRYERALAASRSDAPDHA